MKDLCHDRAIAGAVPDSVNVPPQFKERVMTFDVRTNHWLKPIPLRQFDWEAVMDNYEPGCPIGYGRTEQEAIDDLLEQIEP